ncbi:MAG: glutathione S-transferase family protein [Microcoleaceae cyanobacterium]
MNSQNYRLITIPISHYCEKARWALDRLKIPYTEEPHVPLFHRLATQKHGGNSVPVLVTENHGNFVDSTDILHYLSATAPPDKKLYLDVPELRQEVEELEDLFDKKLAIAVRNWGYFYQAKNRQAMRRGWCTNTPWFEQMGFAIAFPYLSNFFCNKLELNAENAASSLTEIKHIFNLVGQRLADGRSYLVGDNFSTADLTFAALSAPVLMPPEHFMKPQPLSQIPSEMATVIKELQATPAEKYALRLYREERY